MSTDGAAQEREPVAWITEVLFDNGWSRPGHLHHTRTAAEYDASTWSPRDARVTPLYAGAAPAERAIRKAVRRAMQDACCLYNRPDPQYPDDEAANAWEDAIIEAIAPLLGARERARDAWLIVNGEKEALAAAPSTHQRDLLATALREVLVADGVIRPDAEPNGPELLLAAEGYAEHRGTEAAPTPEQEPSDG